jgi:hypothetical protein
MQMIRVHANMHQVNGLFLAAMFVFSACSVSTKRVDPLPLDSVALAPDTLTVADVDTVTPLPPDTLTIVAVGDLMLGTWYPDSSYLPPDSGKGVLAAAAPQLRRGDITFGNLEGVLLSDSGRVKRCANPRFCYAFKSPDYYVRHFSKSSFDLLSLANNHTNDFGAAGKRRTRALLDSVGIAYAGISSWPDTLVERHGVRIGFAAFAPNTGTINLHDSVLVEAIVSRLDSLADLVVVSFHFGAEGAKHKHITRQTEFYVGENRGNPYALARRVIDAGADVVLGHGPHVPRAIDLYRQRFIAYSLGNFATYGRFNLRGTNAYAPLLRLQVNRQGHFLGGEIISFIQQGRGIPVPDREARAALEIRKLTAQDIPEAGITIDDQGQIMLISTIPEESSND